MRSEVFRVFTDFAHAPQHIKGIRRVELLERGETGVGTRFRETRIVSGNESTEEMEITVFDPHNRYVVKCESCGVRYSAEFDFESEGDNTSVTLVVEARPLSLLAKLWSPIGYLRFRGMKRVMDQDLEDLKALLESGASVQRN